MAYPTELIAKAHYEIGLFERVSSTIGIELLNELSAWRERFPEYEYRVQDDCISLKFEAPLTIKEN